MKKKNEKKFRGCYRAMNFCTQSQWDLGAILFTTQKKVMLIFPDCAKN